MKTSCDPSECCPTSNPTSGACQGPAQCLNDAGSACPVEGATRMWAESFGDAMRQAQTDLLKTRILKAWGPMMEPAADAMVAAMGALWQEKIAGIRTAEAKQAFQKTLRDLWLDDRKK